MKRLMSFLCMLIAFLILGSVNDTNVNASVTVKSIEITSNPDKCAYNVGDGYSTKGMVVVAKMSDGTKETVDNTKIKSVSGVELTDGRAFTQAGWKSVEISYQGAKTSYAIVVFDPAKEYSITFDSAGGSSVKAIKIDASTKEFKLPTPKKKGAKFLGWYHSNGNKYTKYQQGMGPSLEFTAKWAYTITFNANGGTGKMKQGTLGDDYNLPKNGFKRSGYKFVGWSTKKTADYNSFYLVGDPASYISNKDKSITLYAQWVKAKSYKITYVTVKGVKVESNAIKKYTAGKTTMLPYAQMTGDYDKIFAGWLITVDGKKQGVHMEIPPYISGNIKITPVFENFEG